MADRIQTRRDDLIERLRAGELHTEERLGLLAELFALEDASVLGLLDTLAHHGYCLYGSGVFDCKHDFRHWKMWVILDGAGTAIDPVATLAALFRHRRIERDGRWV